MSIRLELLNPDIASLTLAWMLHHHNPLWNTYWLKHKSNTTHASPRIIPNDCENRGPFSDVFALHEQNSIPYLPLAEAPIPPTFIFKQTTDNRPFISAQILMWPYTYTTFLSRYCKQIMEYLHTQIHMAQISKHRVEMAKDFKTYKQARPDICNYKTIKQQFHSSPL